MTQAGQGMLSRLEDLPGYDIQVVLDVETLTISGDQRVVYTNRHTAPLTEVYFNLYANARRFGGQMTVTDVTGNGNDGTLRSGFRFADGAIAMVPVQAGPRSERISPNRFEPTTTSKCSGMRTKFAVRMSI